MAFFFAYLLLFVLVNHDKDGDKIAHRDVFKSAFWIQLEIVALKIEALCIN